MNNIPGYSGTPLAKKLGIKAGTRLLAVGAPEEYWDWLEPLPEDVAAAPAPGSEVDLVHLFADRAGDLGRHLADLRAKLRPDAPLWISWPKKSSKVPTDITEDTIRELALPLGWVDVKVCAVSEIWSGLKLVVRKELR